MFIFEEICIRQNVHSICCNYSQNMSKYIYIYIHVSIHLSIIYLHTYIIKINIQFYNSVPLFTGRSCTLLLNFFLEWIFKKPKPKPQPNKAKLIYTQYF